MRRRWRRARGGSGAGGEGTELNDGEEPIMLRSIDVAVRKRDGVLRNAGRGGGGWPQDVAGVVDLDSVEPEGDGDRSAGNEILVADKRARVAEAGRLNLALELVNTFVVEGESTIGCISRERGRRGSAVGEVGQGGAGGWVPSDPGNGIGQVSDAGVGVDGWEIAGEARGDRCADSRGADDELEDDFCFFADGGLAGEPPPPPPELPPELAEDDAAAAAGDWRASEATMPGYALDSAYRSSCAFCASAMSSKQ